MQDLHEQHESEQRDAARVLPARPTRDWCGEQRLEDGIARCRSARARASGLHYVRLVGDRFLLRALRRSAGACALSVGLGFREHFFDPGRIGLRSAFDWRLDRRRLR